MERGRTATWSSSGIGVSAGVPDVAILRIEGE